jgi:hypothetical protein
VSGQIVKGERGSESLPHPALKFFDPGIGGYGAESPQFPDDGIEQDLAIPPRSSSPKIGMEPVDQLPQPPIGIVDPEGKIGRFPLEGDIEGVDRI